MTANTMSAIKSSNSLLRNTLRVDAVASGVSGAGLVALGGLHEELFGLPRAWSLPMGIFLLVFAALAGLASTGTRGVPAIVAVNVAWVIASVVMVFALPLTGLGVGYVVAQAVAVAVFAELEFVGLRRASR
jgi:hypothetical protein